MPAIIGLLYAVGVFLLGAGQFLEGAAKLADTELVRDYFHGRQQSQAEQHQPPLSEGAEVLYKKFGRQMDLQHQNDMLLREILKMPEAA